MASLYHQMARRTSRGKDDCHSEIWLRDRIERISEGSYCELAWHQILIQELRDFR